MVDVFYLKKNLFSTLFWNLKRFNSTRVIETKLITLLRRTGAIDVLQLLQIYRVNLNQTDIYW